MGYVLGSRVFGLRVLGVCWEPVGASRILWGLRVLG